MKRSVRRHKESMVFSSQFLLLLLSLWAPAALASTVSGTVTNKTTNRPGDNDDVVLIALAQNMQEVARTKTDAKGHYRLDLPNGSMHLIRVDHQKASYFASIAPGAKNVNVTVYDVSPKLDMVTMEADMVRIETDMQGLHVIESYFVKNDSNPPRTQLGPKGFEIYLPPEAKVDASVAMGPGGMPVASPPVPSGSVGHYSFLFPVRPGETRFQVEYHVPYAGSRKLDAKLSLRTGNYAVVLPNGMDLKQDGGTSFEPMNGDAGTRSLLAKNIVPEMPIHFTVTGTGTLPRENGTADRKEAGPEDTPSSPATTNTSPGGGMAAPINTADPLDKYKWWFIGGLVLTLASVAPFLLRSSRAAAVREPAPQADLPPLPADSTQSFWLAALRDELFALETERIKGQLSEEDYRIQKAAFEIVMKRALTHQPQSAADVEAAIPPISGVSLPTPSL